MNSVVVRNENIFENLVFMSSFDKFLVMNSSYAWWPIFLADKKKESLVIMPKKWYLRPNKDIHPLQEISTILF